MELPRGYNRGLRRFDPDLRMRWSGEREEWLLERKFARSVAPGVAANAFSDAAIQARDGYLELGSYGPRELPSLDRLVAHLRWADTWNMGMNANDIADHMDREWVAAERTRARKFRELVGEAASDSWDSLGWREGRTVTVPR